MTGEAGRLRIDKWLWAARFFKTRGPAPEAQRLYRESDESRARRAALAAQIRAMPQPAFKGRPTKRDRREIERFESGGVKGGAG